MYTPASDLITSMEHMLISGREPTSLILKPNKERDLTQSYNKSPYTNRKFRKAKWQHKNASQNFDFTTIADQLRTVSWSNRSYNTRYFFYM